MTGNELEGTASAGRGPTEVRELLRAGERGRASGRAWTRAGHVGKLLRTAPEGTAWAESVDPDTPSLLDDPGGMGVTLDTLSGWATNLPGELERALEALGEPADSLGSGG